MLNAAEILFWGSLGIVVYSYFLYPLIVAALVKLTGARPTAADDSLMPTVSVVISVYNEDAVLPEKLHNLEGIDYPRDKLEFVFGSDGSNDRTNELLSGWDHPCKRVMFFTLRRGKSPVLNDLLGLATGEVVVFSDANTMYEPHTIRRLVRCFADPAVGAVCGELVLLPEASDAGGVGEISYWAYENWLKRMESDFDTLLGAAGGLYGIRRHLYVPLPVNKSVTDDFLIPLKIVMQGFRVIYARDAIAYERTSGSMNGEFLRKARIGAQNYAGIAEFAPLLSPRAGFTSFALWSHKIIRWSVPFLAIIAFLATATLAFTSTFYTVVFALELAFLLVGAGGFIADRLHIHLGRAGLPFYILAMNMALLVGFFRFLSKRQHTTWEVLR